MTTLNLYFGKYDGQICLLFKHCDFSFYKKTLWHRVDGVCYERSKCYYIKDTYCFYLRDVKSINARHFFINDII